MVFKLYLIFLLYVSYYVFLIEMQCTRRFGPTKSEMLHFGECADTGTHEIVFDIKFSRDQKNGRVRSFCYIFNISLPLGINDYYSTVEEIYCLDSVGTWKSMWTTRHERVCTDVRAEGKGQPNWMRQIKAHNFSQEDCPIPKGNYSFDCTHVEPVYAEMTKDTTDKQIFFYGQYKIIQSYYRDGVRVGCAIEITKIYPA